MEARELRYFIQIVKDGSYTKAAKNLYVSQPSLSKMMKKLENELKVPLLDAHSNGVFPTDYGKALFRRAEPLIQEFDSLNSFMQDVEELKCGALTIGVTSMLDSLYISGLVVDFCNRYPAIEVKLIENGSKVVRSQLAENKIDIGICLAGDAEEGISETILLKDDMVVCVSRNHPLAREKMLSFEQLREQPFNLFSTASTLYGQTLARCAEAGFVPRVNILSSQINVILQMTASGNGLCILPHPYAERFLPQDLRLIPIRESFPWVACIAKRKGSYQTPAARTFEHFVLDFFRSNKLSVSKK